MFEAVHSKEPLEIHHRLIIHKGVGEQQKMTKMKTPCSAISISKKANGDIVSASFSISAAFNWDVMISIILQIDRTTSKNATLLALDEIKNRTD